MIAKKQIRFQMLINIRYYHNAFSTLVNLDQSVYILDIK